MFIHRLHILDNDRLFTFDHYFFIIIIFLYFYYFSVWYIFMTWNKFSIFK